MPFQLPSMLELGAVAVLAGILLAIRSWLARSRWTSLATAYPHPGAFPDSTIHVRGAELNGLVPRRGLLLGADDRGLHVASAGGRHRALVPWRAIRAEMGPPGDIQDLPASLMFGPEADQWLYLPLPAARELAALAAKYWPGSRRLGPDSSA